MAEPGAGEDAVQQRMRLLACSLVLTAAAFLQEPGRLVGDTKLDLALAPGTFLGRASHLWDPIGAFGQVQNQAYGYLFPMGPFFWAGDQLGVPGWVVQRLWWALLLVTAFLGAVTLARILEVGTPGTRLLGGFAFALSPRLLTTLGPISIEAWPSALAPWVLAALVWGSRGRVRPVVAAGWAALGVAVVGGVNAAATSAVLPLGVLWLLTREGGPRRRALLIWWPVLTVLLTLWWLVPLLLLGRYSPPFLDVIEPASVTTAVTSLVDALRGTSNWVPYIEPGWRAGNDLLTTPFLVVNTGVVLVLGVAGLARRDLPHRRFLVLAVVAGLLLVTAGHLGPAQGPFAATVRDLLDGALAPLRNVHKFDVVLRLPLVLGLVHLASVAASAARERGTVAAPTAVRRPWRLGLVAAVAVAGGAGPVIAGRLAPAGSFAAVPGYWQEAADWLAARNDGTRALLVPGSSFGTYLWGEPRDEPMQALAQSPWAVRNAVPLAPAGNIRMLDAVEEVLDSGRPSPGLAAVLARAGIGHLVVRNDLLPSGDVPDPVLVRQTLATTPGLTRVASFGPPVGGRVRLDDAASAETPRLVVNDGWQGSYPPVEIFAVTGAAAAVRSEQPDVVVGGPEDLLTLADSGMLSAQPAQLAVDLAAAPPPDARVVLTDGLRRRDRVFGRIHQAYSAVLGAGEAADRDVPARDYLLPDQDRWETTARWEGVRDVRASSSTSDGTTLGPVRPDQSPAAAFDADPDTSWVSGFEDEPWLEIELLRPLDPGTVTLTAGGVLGEAPQQVRIVTQAGAGEVVTLERGVPLPVPVPDGSTAWIRVEGASGEPSQRLALASVEPPGVVVTRPLVLPVLPDGWPAPDAVVLGTQGWRSACLATGGDLRCRVGEGSPGEEPQGLDRVVTVPTAASYPVRLSVRPRPGPALDDLRQRGGFVRASASSIAVADPAASPVAAIDEDGATTWIAAEEDPEPTLRLSFLEPQRLTGLRLRLDRQAPATAPDRVTLVHDDGQTTVSLRDGRASFPAFTTDRLDLLLSAAEPARGIDFEERVTELGVGVTELRLRGTDTLPLRLSDTPVDLGCGSGPDLVVDGVPRQTSVTTSARALRDGGGLIDAQVCGEPTVELLAGADRLTFGRSAAFTGVRVVLGEPALPDPAPARADLAGGPVRRAAGLDGGTGELLVVRENRNDGWAATVAGDRLERASVDGWQQGWRLPPGAGGAAALRYSPDTAYRTALAGGGMLLLTGFVALPLLARRRGDRRPAVAESPRAGRALLLAGLVGLVLLSGGWGLLAAGVAGAVALLTPRSRAWPVVVAAPLAAAVVVAAWRPAGDPDGWAGNLLAPQLGALLSVALLVAAELHGARMSRSRRAGSSTTR